MVSYISIYTNLTIAYSSKEKYDNSNLDRSHLVVAVTPLVSKLYRRTTRDFTSSSQRLRLLRSERLAHAPLTHFECGGKACQLSSLFDSSLFVSKYIQINQINIMPRKKRTRGGKPKVVMKPKEEDDLSDVSMCSTTSEAPLSKEEIMARLIEEYKFGGNIELLIRNTLLFKHVLMILTLQEFFIR